jgi:predicted ATPase
MTTIKVTKDEFNAYLKAQQSGVTNMFDITVVSQLTGLSREKLLYIMNNYSELINKFKEN